MFFKIEVYDDSGTVLTDQNPLWQELHRLPLLEPANGGRYRHQDFGLDWQAAKVEYLREYAVLGYFYKARRDDLPPKTNLREDWNELDLDDDEALQDRAHFAWIDLRNYRFEGQADEPSSAHVLVWEYNHRAPRPPGLARYLNDIFDQKYEVVVTPILAPDVWRQLENAPELGAITVAIDQSKVAEGLLNIFPLARLAGFGPAETARVEVVFRPRRNLKFANTESQRRGLQKWAEVDAVTKLKVAQKGSAELDLLAGKVRDHVDIPRRHPSSRAVDPGFAYAELVRKYQEERSRVLGSLGLVRRG